MSIRSMSSGSIEGRPVSLSEIKSGHSDGVICRELVSRECAQRPEQPAVLAHPCLARGVFSHHCNMPYTEGACGADAAPRKQRHGQDIPAVASRSAVPYVHSAMANGARLAGHECPWHEAAG